MKQYLLSVYQPQGSPPSREVLDKVMADLAAVNREMRAAGAWILAGGLQPSHAAKVARAKDGAIVTTDGPFAETKEVLGGIYVIAAPDLNTALEWAGKVARAATLPIEVREFQDEPRN